MFHELEYLKKINEKMFDCASLIKAELDKNFKLKNTKVYIDEESFEYSYIRFEFTYDFNYQISFGELEQVSESFEYYSKYSKQITNNIRQTFLKETIEK